jgi:four helix bundle protein
MAKGDDIRDRLIRFAVDAMDLCDSLPKTSTGAHIAAQLLRCATSAAPNYAEARGAESRKDFVHKLRIVLKELNEAETWIELVVRRQMVEGHRTNRIMEDCKTLCRIIAASVRTAGAIHNSR